MEFNNLDNYAFMPETKRSEKGVEYKLYFRDPVKVLQNQI